MWLRVGGKAVTNNQAKTLPREKLSKKVQIKNYKKMEKNAKNNGNVNTNTNVELTRIATKNFMFRVWDLAKYHKDVEEQETNFSGCAYKSLYRAVVDAANVMNMAQGLPATNTEYEVCLKDDYYENLFGTLLIIATNTDYFNDDEKELFTAFDVKQWYSSAISEMCDTNIFEANYEID